MTRISFASIHLISRKVSLLLRPTLKAVSVRAVITEELARRLFDTAEGVVGRSFSLDYVNYRVCGVVRSASYLTSDSYAQVYIPYSVIPKYRDSNYGIPYLGAFGVTFLVKDDAQAEALRAEIQEIVRKENLLHADECR